MQRQMKTLWVSMLATLMLSACVTLERPERDYPKTDDFAPAGFKQARFSATDPSIPARLEADARENMHLKSQSSFDILALSGGGADGAFGAGVLLGWTKRGDRPQFRMVTGVSTGALIAPFAFLGPDYDDELRDAYTSGAADNLRQSRGILSLFTPGVLNGGNLLALVDRYVDEDMLRAIAREHAKGRRLLVATTNLDAQTGVLWDIGQIASEAIAAKSPARLKAGRDLIAQVLVASSSVPGAFVPVMIDVERPIVGGVQHFKEMHVDGGVTLPFFILPESMMNWTVPRDLIQRGHIYILVNGKITPQPAITTYNALYIMGRSLDTLTKAQARSTLISVQSFADRNGLEMSMVSLPDEFVEGGMLAFDADSMRRVFYYGFQLGDSPKLWTKDAEAQK